MMRAAIGALLLASPVLAQPVASRPTAQVDEELTQALLAEGRNQLQERAFDQALANFLAAYARAPRPAILFDIAGTLRDMGRTADAANTYHRFLTDPAASAERVDEAKALLAQLDAELTILDVRVTPRDSHVSIDGGPFVRVGSSLITRVRPGIHMVRVRKGSATAEISINGFEGETKQISAVVPGASATPTPSTVPGTISPWLTNGTLYATSDVASNVRRTRETYGGDEVAAVIPEYEVTDSGQIRLRASEQDDISSGAIAVMRIDGEGRGAAGGAGIAISRRELEIEAMVLRSELWGAYLGGRYRFLLGMLRPYVGIGLPTFFFEDRMDGSTRVAVGLRGAGGLEVRVNRHLSVQADLGYEHFFVDEQETSFDANVLVPTLGVIGRL